MKDGMPTEYKLMVATLGVTAFGASLKFLFGVFDAEELAYQIVMTIGPCLLYSLVKEIWRGFVS